VSHGAETSAIAASARHPASADAGNAQSSARAAGACLLIRAVARGIGGFDGHDTDDDDHDEEKEEEATVTSWAKGGEGGGINHRHCHTPLQLI
jgi:hypothetical protein